jgi:hypothetical protein
MKREKDTAGESEEGKREVYIVKHPQRQPLKKGTVTHPSNTVEAYTNSDVPASFSGVYIEAAHSTCSGCACMVSLMSTSCVFGISSSHLVQIRLPRVSLR